MSSFNFRVPTFVKFGGGVSSQVGREATSLIEGAKPRAMIITDPGIIDAGLLLDIEAQLSRSGCSINIFDQVEPNPKNHTIDEAAKQFNRSGANILVAVGGGSVLDASKAIGAVAAYGGQVTDYEGIDTVPGKIAPFIAVPTTAGTGSEITPWAVISVTSRKAKMGIADFKIAPSVALVDPRMTYTLPRELTIGTGFDALTHAIEAYTCKLANPLSDTLALKAIERIVKNLPRAANKGKDKMAREEMMLGSLLAGMAFSNSELGGVHCLSEIVGGYYDGPHGILNGIFLPYVMAYNLPEIPERFAEICLAMGVEYKPEAAVERVIELRHELGLPRLNEFGVKTADIPMLAKMMMTHPSTPYNSRELKAENFKDLLECSLAGTPPI